MIIVIQIIYVRTATMNARIKDIIDDIKDTIEWILNGCPKPQPIKVPSKDKGGKNGNKRN